MNIKIIRHGEVILKEINKLPLDAKLKIETDKQIIAHSETGHHHTLVSAEPAQKFQILTDLDGNTYIQLNSCATLIHEKTGNDVHTPHRVMPAIYQIVIKRQFDYFEKKLKAVRD